MQNQKLFDWAIYVSQIIALVLIVVFLVQLQRRKREQEFVYTSYWEGIVSYFVLGKKRILSGTIKE